jgi:hypothetical protein
MSVVEVDRMMREVCAEIQASRMLSALEMNGGL